MKKTITKKMTITKIAAAAMAVMLAGAAVPAAAVMPVYAIGGSSTSDESEVEMKAALTKVKQRVDIPEELTEFTYSTGKSYGTKVFEFTWKSERDINNAGIKYIQVSVVGDMITRYEYYDDKERGYSSDPTLAKLTEEEILAKAEGYIKQLDPKIAGSVKAEVGSLNLFGNSATVRFKRYVNGILVSGNGGSVTINKNTGVLYSFDAQWWDNADFQSPEGAKTEKEIEEAYKKLCKLTPYYKINTNWETKKKTVRIVYEPDFTSEIDAFTGEASTIWVDMEEAGGTRFYGYYTATDEAVEEDAAAAVENPATGVNADGGVVFTEAELKKIQQDKNLLTAEQVFELLKKDKFAALTDDYEIKSYEVRSSEQDYDIMPLTADSAVNKQEKKEKFYIDVTFTAKDKKYKGYKTVYVTMNAETGEMIDMKKYNITTKLEKLNVENAKAVAEAAANQYAKDIMKECHPDVSNDSEVEVWNGGFETSRNFRFNRFVNGIQVYGDYINVTVDSNGVVTDFSCNYTDDVKFPSADILSSDEALDKLYTQRDFDYYYTGWITKDGKVQTYLLYDIDSFYLNAKTGRLCGWNGEPLNDYTNSRDVKYTDIKGIPQEQAILTMQKYGVTVTNESQFKPNEIITKEEFDYLLGSALKGYAEDVWYEGMDETAYKAERAKPATRNDAAALFTKMYDRDGISELKEIYKTPFSDVKSNDENIGAIAIAYAKGFIPKGNGKFNGEQKITRAEAVQMIYDYLVHITK